MSKPSRKLKANKADLRYMRYTSNESKRLLEILITLFVLLSVKLICDWVVLQVSNVGISIRKEISKYCGWIILGIIFSSAKKVLKEKQKARIYLTNNDTTLSNYLYVESNEIF